MKLKLTSGQRLSGAVGQLKRRRARREYLGFRPAIHQQLQRQANIFHPLRFIDHHQLGLADVLF